MEIAGDSANSASTIPCNVYSTTQWWMTTDVVCSLLFSFFYFSTPYHFLLYYLLQFCFFFVFHLIWMKGFLLCFVSIFSFVSIYICTICILETVCWCCLWFVTAQSIYADAGYKCEETLQKVSAAAAAAILACPSFPLGRRNAKSLSGSSELLLLSTPEPASKSTRLDETVKRVKTSISLLRCWNCCSVI